MAAANNNAATKGVSPALAAYLDPSNITMTPAQAVAAAHAIANSQTVGPLNDLAASIAQTNRGTTASEKLVGGYYNQFGKSAQQGVNDTRQIGTNLQNTLGGINQDTQTQLQGIGQNAAGAVNAYMPAGDQSLGSGPLQSLAANMARQQGYAAQYGQIAAGTGALQSQNYSDMAAGMKGTGAVAGTQALGELARAGRLAVQPLTQKVADLKQQRGTLYTNALNQIKQQEITNQFTATGLGNTAASIAATSANEAANRRFTATQNALDRAARLKIEKTVQTGETNRSAASIQARKDAAAKKKAAGSGTGGVTPLPQSEQNTLYKGLREMTTLITEALGHGATQAQIKTSLNAGTFAKGFPAQDIVLVNAAFELVHYGFVWPTTAAAMRSMGLRGGMWNGKPIRVSKPVLPSGQGVTSAGKGAAGGVASVAG